MEYADLPEVVLLQKLAFPPPFSEDLHWDEFHLCRHVELFPGGQFVAVSCGRIVGSCSNAIISDEKWMARCSWASTVGGPCLENHYPQGSTLYGLDITVAPGFRRMGVGRSFYNARFRLLSELGLKRYGTGCRLPDYRNYVEKNGFLSAYEYAASVTQGKITDRTLTPLMHFGLTFIDVIEDYMEDNESCNAAALLEWLP